MQSYINSAVSNIEKSLPKIKNYFEEYKNLNQLINPKNESEEKYDLILLNFNTEEMKQSVGMLSSIFYHLEKGGFDAIQPIFNKFEMNQSWELEIFCCKQILERYNENNTEEGIVIKLKTYKKIFDALTNNNDKFNQLKYSIIFLEYFLENSNKLSNLKNKKEILEIISEVYLTLYMIDIFFLENKINALKNLEEAYITIDYSIEKGYVNWINTKAIFVLINLVGLYSDIRNMYDLDDFEIKKYIKEVLKYLKKIRTEIEEYPHFMRWFKEVKLQKYLHQLLTNIYILGFTEEHKEALKILPILNTLDYSLIIDLDNLSKNVHKYTFEEIENKLSQYKSTMERLLNNLPQNKKESLLFSFYNCSVFVYDYFHEEQKLKEIYEELYKLVERNKNTFLLKVPLLKLYIIFDETDKAKEIGKEIIQKSIITGRENLRIMVEDVLKDII
jgi:hypothetical protein